MKSLASVDEMVNSGMVVIMRKTGGIAQRLDLEVERKIRNLVEGGAGSEVILERAGGSFTFEMDVKSEGGGCKGPTRPARCNNQMTDVNETKDVESFLAAVCEVQERSEIECSPCKPHFQRRWVNNSK